MAAEEPSSSQNPMQTSAAPAAPAAEPVVSQPKPGLGSGIRDHTHNSCCTVLRRECKCCPPALCDCFEAVCPCCFVNCVHHLFPDAPAVYIDGDIEHTHEKAAIIASFMRLVIARRRVRMLQRLRHRPFNIKVVRATGLNARKSDLTTTVQHTIIGAADPYIVVTALQDNCDHAHSGTDQALFYKTRTIKQSSNPVWNENICVSGCNGFAKLIFTVLQNDPASFGNLKLLGQTSYSIAQHDLWTNDVAPFEVKLQLGPVVENVFGENGKAVPVSSEGNFGGELIIELQPTSTTGMMSSWAESYNVNRKSLTERAIMGPMLLNLADETGWLPRWVVLSEFGIKEYLSPQNLNNVTNEIPAEFIGAVTVEPEYRGKEAVVRIQNTAQGGIGMILHIPEGADWHEWELKIDVVKKAAAKRALVKQTKARSPAKPGLVASLRNMGASSP